MKNLGTLYKYELKKLLRRPLSWALVLVMAVFCAYSIFRFGVSSGSGMLLPILDEDGNETGEEQFIPEEEIQAVKREAAGKLNGKVMDDAFFREMLEAVPDIPFPQLEVYFLTEDATYLHPYSLVEGLFPDARTVTEEEFYDRIWEQTQASFERWDLSGGEKAYWTQQASRIEKPFVYQDYWRGLDRAFDTVYTFFTFLPVAAAACLCTIFSEDRRTRVDALVFASRESRLPLYLAKVLAGITVAALAAAVIIGAVAGALLYVWGTDGLNAPLQMYDTVSPRPVTVGQVFLPIILLLVLFTLVYGGLTMLVSALTHNSLAALAGPVLLCFMMQYFYYHAQEAGRWGDYFRQYLMGYYGVNNLRLVNLFGLYLDNYQFGSLLYGAAAALLMAVCWPGWRRSAAGRG